LALKTEGEKTGGPSRTAPREKRGRKGRALGKEEKRGSAWVVTDILGRWEFPKALPNKKSICTENHLPEKEVGGSPQKLSPPPKTKVWIKGCKKETRRSGRKKLIGSGAGARSKWEI